MKRLVSLLLAVAMLLSGITVFAEDLLGLKYAGRTSSPISGAVAKTPEEYIFQYEGKNFILLDTYEKDGKTYFFVMADDTYGAYKFDTGRGNDDCLGYWNIDDPLNMAYWLNNDFWNKGNGSVALPDGIKDYIDENHIWHTEPVKGLSGWTEEVLTEAPLALLANYEWKQYITKIGQSQTVAGNNISMYYFRTTRSDLGQVNYPLYTGGSTNTPLGTTNAWRANGTPLSIRPLFYLESDFFANEKVFNIGSDVALKIAEFINADLYTQEEIDALYSKPSATVEGIVGEKMVGETVTVNYTYSGSVAEAESEIKWYVADDANGEFTEVAGEGKELVLTENLSDKFLKAGVTPVSAANINSRGEEVLSDAFGPIFGTVQIESAISEIKASENPFTTLTEYSYMFGISEIEAVADVDNAEKVFLSIEFTNISEVQDAYEKAILIQKLNDAKLDSDIADLLASYEWDIEGYAANCQSASVIATVRDNNFDSLSAFIDALNSAIVVAAFETATTAEMRALLKTYAETFDIKKLTAYEIYNLAKDLSDETFETFDELTALVSGKGQDIIKNRANTNDEKLIGLSTPGRRNDANPYPGAVANTPAEILFVVEGKEFAILDSTEKDGKTYYFVIADESYGQTQYDKTPGVTTESALGTWDINNEYNMAYWLNTEFWDNGNNGNKLPESIKEYIDKNHIWHTEPMKHLEGYQNEILTVAPLAVPADYEWKKYISLIGQNEAGTYWFRTTRGDVNTSNILIATGNMTLGSNTGWNANAVTGNVRPVFYLSEDFFKNAKVESAGTEVSKKVDSFLNASLYTKEQLDKVIAVPAVSDIKIVGDAVIGEKLTVSYEYESVFEEATPIVYWYAADDADSEFTKFAEGVEITLNDSVSDKVIKASVTPVSKSVANPKGYETEMAEAVVVYNKAMVDDMVSAINNASIGELKAVIDSYYDILFISTELEGFEAESKLRIYNSLADMTFTDIASVRNGFYGHVALENVNIADEENIDEMLHQEYLGFETAFYDRLEDKSGINKTVSDKDYDNLEEFLEELTTLVALEEFNNADRTNIVTLLADYSEMFSDFEDYSDKELKTIGASMIGKDYKTLDDIEKAFDSGVKSLDDDKDSAGGGGGGGSSSGSSSKNKTVNFGAAYTDIVIPQPSESSDVFSDLDDAEWAKEMIVALYEKNIVNGYGDGTFRPNEPLTREAFVTMIVRAFEVEQGERKMNFSDVEDKAWYCEPIREAYACGIINGISDTEFGVGSLITREDMMTILYRVLENPEVTKQAEFADIETIADYAKDAVSYMTEKGYANGTGNNLFEPKLPTTRAMAAKMIALILN